ncbi:hypothetical protein CRENBAI_024414 [Crenichthys baileyi]|uniref:Uncharacterized protein n=1 Tax=Crenichthys baileyi TaxID=28760 RepID=A0AAV9R2K6_9TELE
MSPERCHCAAQVCPNLLHTPQRTSVQVHASAQVIRGLGDASAQVIGGLGDASALAYTTEGLGDASALAYATEGLGDASALAYATEGLGDASALAYATEGLSDASAPAHATEGLGDASAPAHATEGLRWLQGSPTEGLGRRLSSWSQGFEEEEPPDPVSEGFKEQLELVLASKGPPDAASVSEDSPEGSPGAASASKGSPGIVNSKPDSNPDSGPDSPPRVLDAPQQATKPLAPRVIQTPIYGVQVSRGPVWTQFSRGPAQVSTCPVQVPAVPAWVQAGRQAQVSVTDQETPKTSRHLADPHPHTLHLSPRVRPRVRQALLQPPRVRQALLGALTACIFAPSLLICRTEGPLLCSVGLLLASKSPSLPPLLAATVSAPLSASTSLPPASMVSPHLSASTSLLPVSTPSPQTAQYSVLQNFVPVRDDVLVARLNFVPARGDILAAPLNFVPAREDLLVDRLNFVPARDDLLVARLNFFQRYNAEEVSICVDVYICKCDESSRRPPQAVQAKPGNRAQGLQQTPVAYRFPSWGDHPEPRTRWAGTSSPQQLEPRETKV